MIRVIGTALYQWDTGRSVSITDIEADKVHFANKGDSKAVIMDISNSQAKIPDYLLQTGKQLCVYVVKNGSTVETKTFSVGLRERPENYVYEDDQRNYIYELIQSAEAATEAATMATESANNAAKRAEEAAESVNGIDAVLFVEQDLTEAQKAQARKNIGVSSSGGGGESTVENAVLYTPQELTEEQQAQARENLYVPSVADFDDLSLTVDQHRNGLEEADEKLGRRVDSLEQGFRHIVTYTIETDDGSGNGITKDKDGNPFSCSEFHILMTIPPTQGSQLYVCSEMWKYMFFTSVARSATATRTLSIDVRHIGGGWWNGSMLYGDNVTSLPSAINGYSKYSNFRSNVVIGEKASSLWFYGGSAPLPNGTVIEIYGK